MEPWDCITPAFDIRTASASGPFYRGIDPFQLADADLDLVFNNRRIQYLVEKNEQRNEDGTINVVLVARAKLQDEEGLEFYVRDEEMPFDENRFQEFKGWV